MDYVEKDAPLPADRPVEGWSHGLHPATESGAWWSFLIAASAQRSAKSLTNQGSSPRHDDLPTSTTTIRTATFSLTTSTLPVEPASPLAGGVMTGPQILLKAHYRVGHPTDMGGPAIPETPIAQTVAVHINGRTVDASFEDHPTDAFDPLGYRRHQPVWRIAFETPGSILAAALDTRVFIEIVGFGIDEAVTQWRTIPIEQLMHHRAQILFGA